MIKDNLQTAMKQAMKVKDEKTRDYCKVILSEFARIEKNPDDDKAISIIKKLIKSETENIEMSGKEDHSYLKFLETYMPQQLSKQNIEEWAKQNIDFSSLRNKMQAVGIICKQFGTTVDGKLVKEVVEGL